MEWGTGRELAGELSAHTHTHFHVRCARQGGAPSWEEKCCFLAKPSGSAKRAQSLSHGKGLPAALLASLRPPGWGQEDSISSKLSLNLDSAPMKV